MHNVQCCMKHSRWLETMACCTSYWLLPTSARFQPACVCLLTTREKVSLHAPLPAAGTTSLKNVGESRARRPSARAHSLAKRCSASIGALRKSLVGWHILAQTRSTATLAARSDADTGAGAPRSTSNAGTDIPRRGGLQADQRLVRGRGGRGGRQGNHRRGKGGRSGGSRDGNFGRSQRRSRRLLSRPSSAVQSVQNLSGSKGSFSKLTSRSKALHQRASSEREYMGVVCCCRLSMISRCVPFTQHPDTAVQHCPSGESSVS